MILKVYMSSKVAAFLASNTKEGCPEDNDLYYKDSPQLAVICNIKC